MSTPGELGDDVDLLLKLKEGDRCAFEALYKKYWSYVYNSAYKRVKDIALAEDITHDVFIQLWNAPKGTLISNLKGYLFISARNRVLRLFERQSKFVPIEEVLAELKEGISESSDANLLYQELSQTYAALILDLTQQQQIIYDLKYTKDLSADEIALMLKLSPKTVRNQIGKINYKLRASLLGLQCILWFLFG